MYQKIESKKHIKHCLPHSCFWNKGNVNCAPQLVLAHLPVKWFCCHSSYPLCPCYLEFDKFPPATVFFVIAALLLSAFQRPANILEITNLAQSLSMDLSAPSHSLSDWVQSPEVVTWSNHCNHRQYILWIIFKPFASLSLGNIMESCTDRSWLFQHSLERVLFGCCVLPSLKLMGHILK